MKCLGALDSFIVKLFFIESSLLGFIASVLGFLLGWLLISVINLFTQGTVAFSGQFWKSSLMLMLLSVFIGTLLTFLATIFPAIRAAKMPPSAALRVEI
jgi:ABC-type lipoprotein release transport system permease subunit